MKPIHILIIGLIAQFVVTSVLCLVTLVCVIGMIGLYSGLISVQTADQVIEYVQNLKP